MESIYTFDSGLWERNSIPLSPCYFHTFGTIALYCYSNSFKVKSQPFDFVLVFEQIGKEVWLNFLTFLRVSFAFLFFLMPFGSCMSFWKCEDSVYIRLFDLD